MATSTPGRIGEQNEAYRKGLVLGLTMAEVAILIIFVLLLLLVFADLRRAELVHRFLGKEPVASTDLARLAKADGTLQQIATQLGLQVEDSSDDFTRLIRVIQEANQAPNTKSALTEAKGALADIKRARDEMRRVAGLAQRNGGQVVADQVEQQSFRLANQEGQLKVLENKLLAAGQGKGERPCWAEQNGTIDYLYDVVLTSRGIKMREHVYPFRQRERALLPAPPVDPREILTQSAFTDRTEPLFEYSQQHDCRFFVVVYDATASHEKPLYKDELRTVEGHFYKRLDDGPAPF